MRVAEGRMIRTGDEAAPRPTLAQVAARAGVSLKTASRALGGESYVSEKILASVLAAASELDYQRNAAASLLASGRLADSMGLITGDFTNPFYSALAQAIEDEIRPHGMHLSVANSPGICRAGAAGRTQPRRPPDESRHHRPCDTRPRRLRAAAGPRHPRRLHRPTREAGPEPGGAGGRVARRRLRTGVR